MPSLWVLMQLCIALVIIIQLARLYFADADLTVLWKERFGLKSADVLKGKVVWITGASSGIGEYLAYELSKAGCRLVLSARRNDELERVKRQCLVSGKVSDSDVLCLPLDIIAFDTHQPAVETILKHFSQVDILVNNAGRSQRALVVDTEMEVDRQMLELNVLGAISLTKAVLPHMRERRAGQVVVMNSIAGKIGLPFSASYSASKFALHGWFGSFAMEHNSDNIHVTMVSPGPVFSNFLQNSFTGKIGEKHGELVKLGDKRVKTDRAAELIAVGVANQLPEIWICLTPVLYLMYLQQYAPSLCRYILMKIGMNAIMKSRDSN